MPDEQIWIWLDDAPENVRNHTLMRHHPKNLDEALEDLKGPEFDWLRKANVIDANSEPIVRDQKQRDAAAIAAAESPAAAALDLTVFGRTFAADLLTEISPAERPLCVAPSRAVSTPSASAAFRARYPRFDAERHQRYLDAGHRNFCRAAAAEHRSAQYASQMRCEIVLAALVAAQPVPLAIVNPKLKFPPPDEMPLACGILPVLWQAHEEALIEAESKGLRNSGARPILSTCARLLYDLFRAMTELKVDNAVTSYCKMFKALGVILDTARQELKQR